jgi:hypothetical protein
MTVGEGLKFDFAARTCSKAYHAIEASAWRAWVAIHVITITSTAQNRSVSNLWKQWNNVDRLCAIWEGAQHKKNWKKVDFF